MSGHARSLSSRSKKQQEKFYPFNKNSYLKMMVFQASQSDDEGKNKLNTFKSTEFRKEEFKQSVQIQNRDLINDYKKTEENEKYGPFFLRNPN